MGKKSLLEVKEIFEEQAKAIKDTQQMMEVSLYGFEALGEEDYVISTLKVTGSYLEIIRSNLLKGAEEVEKLLNETGDD